MASWKSSKCGSSNFLIVVSSVEGETVFTKSSNLVDGTHEASEMMSEIIKIEDLERIY